MADETQGQVVAIGDHFFTIRYNVEGKTFRIKEHLPKYGGMSMGRTVSVLYDPNLQTMHDGAIIIRLSIYLDCPIYILVLFCPISQNLWT